MKNTYLTHLPRLADLVICSLILFGQVAENLLHATEVNCRSREILFRGSVLSVVRIGEEVNKDVIKLGIDQRWVVEIAVESIEPNAAGIKDGDRVRFAIPTEQAIAIGVDDGEVRFPDVTNYILDFGLTRAKVWIPLGIRREVGDSNPLLLM